jgi:hypothetical protein
MKTDVDELPPEARKEDLRSIRGRLRAAMIRAGLSPSYRVLLEKLNEQLKKNGKPPLDHDKNRQTVNNWFQPRATAIAGKYLFDVAEALQVSPRWLALREGTVHPGFVEIPNGAEKLLQAWEELPAGYKETILTTITVMARQAKDEYVHGSTPDRRARSSGKS